MKKQVFKINLIVLAIGLMSVSCGGGGGKNPEKIDAEALVKEQMDASAKQSEITAANWQSEVKKRFGIALDLPQGWSFSDVRMYFSGDIVIVIFNQDNDDATKPNIIAESIFNATKAISTEGNFNVDIDSENYKVSKGTVYENFEESNMGIKMLGEDYINAFWYYKKDGIKVVSLDHDSKGKFVVKFEISKITI
ncbi:MAG: hypothetical protein FWH23_03780 [Bacteroidales bacterium]|nr:hypothetical protein [Bacteroidales bacterium]MCL2133112.1 hypothetical protein [Bacteroidales bacterium]